MKTLLVSGNEDANETRKEIKDQIRDVMTLLVSESEKINKTWLEEIVNMVTSNQQENAKQIRDVKRVLESGSWESNETRVEDVVMEIKDEIKDCLLYTSDAADE